MNPWMTVLLIGAGTYLTRLSFIGALGTRTLPPWAQRPLKYVGPAVLAAILVPAVLVRDGAVEVTPLGNPRFLAAVVAGLVAWRTKNVTAVIVVGMVTLWVLQAID